MKPSRKNSGFTLVEILVAIAVLIIMGLIFSQVISMTGSAIHLSNRSVDASAQAYLAFDRIRTDLAAAVKRPDVDFIAQNPTTPVGGGNILLFLANTPSAVTLPGGVTNRNISIVAYQIAVDADNKNLPCLIRGSKPVSWTGTTTSTGFMGLSNGLPLSFASLPAAFLPSTTNTPSDFDVLAPGVIRLVVGFQLYPDNQPVTLSDGSTPNPATAQGQVVYLPPIISLTPTGGGTAVNYTNWQRISALVVGVVALNTDALTMANAAEVSVLANTFTQPNAGALPLASWTTTANTLAASGPTSVPLPIRESVRVYQQSFPLTPYGAQGIGTQGD